MRFSEKHKFNILNEVVELDELSKNLSILIKENGTKNVFKNNFLNIFDTFFTLLNSTKCIDDEQITENIIKNVFLINGKMKEEMGVEDIKFVKKKLDTIKTDVLTAFNH